MSLKKKSNQSLIFKNYNYGNNWSNKKIFEEKSYGDNFKKREIVITTNETYPQHLIIEFHQDKCDLLNNFKVGDDVEIGLNLRGREWKNPEGEFKYFNSIQGWRIKLVDSDSNNPLKTMRLKNQMIYLFN